MFQVILDLITEPDMLPQVKDTIFSDHFQMEDILYHPIKYMSKDFHQFGLDRLPLFTPLNYHSSQPLPFKTKTAHHIKKKYFPYYKPALRPCYDNMLSQDGDKETDLVSKPDETFGLQDRPSDDSLALETSNLGDILYGPEVPLSEPDPHKKIVYPRIISTGPEPPKGDSEEEKTPVFVSPAETILDTVQPDLTDAILHGAAEVMKTLSNTDLMTSDKETELYEKEDAKRKGDPTPGPPSKKEKLRSDVRFLDLSKDVNFEHVRYDSSITLADNINNFFLQLGDKGSALTSTNLLANKIDPAVHVVPYPDPEKSVLASTLHLCNALTSSHIATRDQDIATLQATTAALLSRHQTDNDYEKLRRQLSEERDSHRDELKSARENLKSQVAYVVKDKEEMAAKERDLRNLMITNLESTYQLQMKTMANSHQASTSFLQKTINDLQKAVARIDSTPPEAQLVDQQQIERMTGQLEELRDIIDSKDTVNGQLDEDNGNLKLKINELHLQATEHADEKASLNSKLAAERANSASVKKQLEDATNVATTLHATIDKLKTEAATNETKKTKLKTHLDKMVAQIADLQADNGRLLAVENQLTKLQKLPEQTPDFAKVIKEHQDKLNETDENLKVMTEDFYTLTQQNNEIMAQKLDLEDDVQDLQSQLETINKKLTNEVQEKLTLLESHRLEKKALRKKTDTRDRKDTTVAFERQPFSASTDVEKEITTITDTPASSPVIDKSLFPAGEISAPHKEAEVEQEKKKEKTFPVYDADCRFSKTALVKNDDLGNKPVDSGNDSKSKKEGAADRKEKPKRTEKGEEWNVVCKKGRKLGDERDFKSPSPRRTKEREERKGRDSRSRSRFSTERASSGRQDSTEIENAARDWDEIKRKVNSYQALLEEQFPNFKETMRSPNKTEEEKFSRLEDCLTELHKSENFYDLKAFIKGKKIVRKTTRIPKGALPDLRKDSDEWKLMTTWPQGSEPKENALVHFNNTIVAFRPYCEPLYRVFTTLLAAGNEHRNATDLLFTKPYDGGPRSETQTKRSVEERKFDLLLVLAMAKTFFALKDGREVTGIRRERIRCKEKAYTKEWAKELSGMLDDDVNHSHLNLLLPLYVDTPGASAAVADYYKELAILKEKTTTQAGWFNPF